MFVSLVCLLLEVDDDYPVPSSLFYKGWPFSFSLSLSSMFNVVCLVAVLNIDDDKGFLISFLPCLGQTD